MTAGADTETQARKRTLLDALYRKYHRALMRFLNRRRIGREEAAEIVQETYCRMQKVSDVESIAYPQAFLFRTASNLACNSEKFQRRRWKHEAAGLDKLELVSDEPTPERILKGQQELAIVRRALKELSPKCRRAFMLNRFRSATYEQIAAELDISVSMVEKYISRALAHLKKSLEAGAPSRAAANRAVK